MLPIYLDFNATTPIDPMVLEEMISIYRDSFGNAGSRTHLYGQQAKTIVDGARRRLFSILSQNGENSEIVFTSGATESNNLAILGLARWGIRNNRKHIISTKIEHKSVLEPLRYLANQGFQIDIVGVDRSGRIKAADILNLVKPDTLLVSVMHANNETGVIQPVEELAEALDTTKTLFHVDSAQTFGKLVPQLANLKYDLLSLSGHKIYGPQGIGALVLRKNNYILPPLEAITFGGGQESSLRPGTLPVALIGGLGKATEIAQKEYQEWNKKNALIKETILNQLTNVKYVINGDQNYCMAHTLNLSFPGVESEALMLGTKANYALSNGSACNSFDYKPSHVLTAMGLEEQILEGAIRISWGKTDNVDLTEMIAFIKQFQ